MPIATVHELIKNRLRVKVTSHGYCYCTDAYSKIQTEQLQSLQEAMSIHKQCITWYKVERTNVFNNL